MDAQFNSLPWHDAEVLSINLDRSDAGNNDKVSLTIKWPDGKQNTVVFNDCYLFDARMNFGIVAEESISEAECSEDGGQTSNIRMTWQSLDVELDKLRYYRIATNSTNSQLNIYALSFELL